MNLFQRQRQPHNDFGDKLEPTLPLCIAAPRDKILLHRSGTTNLELDEAGNITIGSELVHYNLYSYNDGKSWVAFNANDTAFLGDADVVYPGLIPTLDAWEALMQQAEAD